MAKVEYGSISITSVSNPIIVLSDSTLDIQKLVLCVSSSATETTMGFYDGTINFTGGSAYGDENATKAITHYRNIGGVKTKVFECTGMYLDTGEFRLSVTTCTQVTQVKFVAYGV